MKVLIVDDEPAICELLGFAFRRREIPFETAQDGESAVQIAHAANPPFDAAIVDKNLPGMSGLDVIARIREKDPRMAILMMTGYASPETAAQALNLDVDAYLEKPFPNMNAVVDRVTAAVDKRRASVPAAVPVPVPSPAAAGAAPVRVLLVTSVDLETGIRATLLPDDPVVVARKETELHASLSATHDLVVIDSFLLGGEVVPVVERVKRTSKDAEFVVISDRALDLRSVQKLIEMGVRRLVQSAGWTRPLKHALDEIRRKKGAG